MLSVDLIVSSFVSLREYHTATPVELVINPVGDLTKRNEDLPLPELWTDNLDPVSRAHHMLLVGIE